MKITKRLLAIFILLGAVGLKGLHAVNSDALDTPIRVAVLPITFEDDVFLSWNIEEMDIDSITIAASIDGLEMDVDDIINPFNSDVGSDWVTSGMLFQSRPGSGGGAGGAADPRPRVVYPGTIYSDLYGDSAPVSDDYSESGDYVWYRPSNPPDRISDDGSSSSTGLIFDENTADTDTDSYGLDSDFLTEYLMTQLVDYSEFDVVDRDSFEEIFEEQELALSGITVDNLSNVGQLLGVEYLLKTKISVIDGEEFYILARLIAVDTGQVPKSDNVFSSVSLGRRGLMDALADLAERLAQKVNGKNPGPHEGILDDSGSGFGGAGVGDYLNGLEVSYLGGIFLTHPGSLVNGGRLIYKIPGESPLRWSIWANLDFTTGSITASSKINLIEFGLHYGYNLIQNGYFNMMIGAGYALDMGFLTAGSDGYTFMQHGLTGTLELGLHLAPAVTLKLEGEFLFGVSYSELTDTAYDQGMKDSMGISALEENGGLMGVMWSAKLGFLF